MTILTIIIHVYVYLSVFYYIGLFNNVISYSYISFTQIKKSLLTHIIFFIVIYSMIREIIISNQLIFL